MVKTNFFKSVLFVAPNYKRRKGGISSVLKQYELNIKDFNFLPSAYVTNKWLNFMLLPITLVVFCLYLIVNKEIKTIHIHGASRGSFYRKYCFYYIGKKLFSKKLVYHIHGAEFHLFYDNSNAFVKAKIDAMISNSDVIIVLSKEWKEYFETTFIHPKIYVLNNIVKRVNEQKKEVYEIITVVFLGRIGERKGTFDLLNVISNNKSFFKDKIQFIIGGDGEISRMHNFIKEEKLDELIKYVGWVSGEKKTDILQKSDIMILPSYNEGLPISLLEAMSYSMPIISTNVGGIPQILEDNYNGKIVNPGNETEIEEALKYYINNREVIKTHGKNSYKIVEDYFPENVISNLKDIYSF
ncbi:glycosyltransferase family 4 protein [Psychroserpens ponticola]|uniref:Glycosyltransferase family 4 protein n=1 Tax=Psychroserpens ponticola TaxID=2932268 RepID=A0ABY7RY73_9FLAO|nr:glycosyltransferase family 4 protein [Psychroserpens ponticola]WCO01641.1 glycosyltransferase family 4 protein [Psychroserpens ponticola]